MYDRMLPSVFLLPRLEPAACEVVPSRNQDRTKKNTPRIKNCESSTLFCICIPGVCSYSHAASIAPPTAAGFFAIRQIRRCIWSSYYFYSFVERTARPPRTRWRRTLPPCRSSPRRGPRGSRTAPAAVLEPDQHGRGERPPSMESTRTRPAEHAPVGSSACGRSWTRGWRRSPC